MRRACPFLHRALLACLVAMLIGQAALAAAEHNPVARHPATDGGADGAQGAAVVAEGTVQSVIVKFRAPGNRAPGYRGPANRGPADPAPDYRGAANRGSANWGPANPVPGFQGSANQALGNRARGDGGIANQASGNGVQDNPPLATQALASPVPAQSGGASPLAQAKAQAPSEAEATTDDTVVALAGRARLNFKQTRRIAGSMHLLRFAPQTSGETLEQSLARLRADPAVEYAEPDQRRYPHALPSDPLYSAPAPGQWYLQSSATTPSAINAEAAWDMTTGGTGIVIAAIDTGVRFDHPDLLRANAGGRLLPGYDFVSDLASSNDNDGRDADPSDPGDWITTTDMQSPNFKNCTVDNSSWHGTRVAGMLGALTSNAAGIAGITWSGWILPVRALGKCGGLDSDIMAAMLWAGGIHVAGVPDNPYPAQIENLSLGSASACSSTYADIISQLVAKGVLVVVSAGNEGGPVDSPANCAGVAGIAGLRQAGTKVGYSSLGPEIALSAPAGNCVNVTPGSACIYSLATTTNLGTTVPAANSYTDQLNSNLGTSFSAPIVAGIAGLMKSVNGNLAPAQLIARLQEGAAKPFPATSDTGTPPVCHVPASSTDTSQLLECSCTTQTCGAGMANANGSVLAALRPIAAIAVPASVSAGQNVALSAAGSGAACNHTVASYSWTNLSTHGVVSNTATASVVAPSSGSFQVELSVTDEAGRIDTAIVTVGPTSATTTAPATAGTTACLAAIKMVTVAVSPTSATVHAGGGSESFVATVANSPDTVTVWEVNGVLGGNATVGTISASGVYSAPQTIPSPAIVTITAVSEADATSSATAQVTVAAASSGGGSFDVLTLSVLGGLLAAMRVTARHEASTRLFTSLRRTIRYNLGVPTAIAFRRRSRLSRTRRM